MPLLKDKREQTTPAPEVEPEAPAGPALLFDGPVLVSWFVLYRLEQELERARRYGSCLTLLVAEPQLIANERVADGQRLIVADAANKSARSTDLVGWLDDGGIIVVLPEADAASARFAASRLRDEMWNVSHVQGSQKWQISLVDDLDEIASFLESVTTAPSADLAA